MREPEGPHEVDVLVVGAGLSGIGAAWHLQHDRPGTSWAILEGRASLGGTWDQFRFPGVRSDSDMYTLSYPFRPWRGSKALADGASILRYLDETARESGIDRAIRYGRRVTRASWSSDDARWTVEAVLAGGGTESWTCRFLYGCTGYYDYAGGYTPDFPGLADFRGNVVHPQFWPEDLDVRGRRVVVIGSGATAVTLVPALADAGAEVTMVQRSPSWVIGAPYADPVARWAQRLLPDRLAGALLRDVNAATAVGFYQLARHRPRLAGRYLRRSMRAVVGERAVAEHFTPAYDPWDQRLCVAPDSDFLHTVADGRAAIVTDRVARFTPDGVEVGSGRVLPADIVVTATGLELQPLGGVALTVDGRPVDLGSTYLYRGCMLSGVPNLGFCVGYVSASWTLRAEVSHRFLIRVLDRLLRGDLASVTPVAPEGMRPRPVLDLSSGYVLRGQDRFPKQGDREPWTLPQNWFADRRTVARATVEQDLTFVAPRRETGVARRGPARRS